jgi:hypothetical protein
VRRLCTAVIFLAVVTNLQAQVGVSGYSTQAEQRLEEHLSGVETSARRNRLLMAGINAAVAAAALATGGIVIYQTTDAYERMHGILACVSGAVLGVASGIMFARPSQAERDLALYRSLPHSTETERVARFVMGESILRNLRNWSFTNRITYAVFFGALSANYFVNGGWITGSAFAGVGAGVLLVPGRPEREWKAYVRETES